METWWKEQAVYQIYPMSYCDSNGDGMGDIPGIISKLPYIKSLGVGIIWLSPVYRSPGEDNGYDISDYCDIDPKFGTLSDMDELIEKANALGLKIVMDLVINHTSSEHEWFQKSRRREAPYEDFYIWRDGRGKRPPNNWTSFFGGGAWAQEFTAFFEYTQVALVSHTGKESHHEDILQRAIERHLYMEPRVERQGDQGEDEAAGHGRRHAKLLQEGYFAR